MDPALLAPLRYGATSLSFRAARMAGWQQELIVAHRVSAVSSADSRVQAALERPVGTRLRELARGATSAAILVPGVDRIAAVARIVPPLLDELDAARVPAGRTTIFLATGTHVHGGSSDFELLLGPGGAKGVRREIHQPREEAPMVDLGTTSRGTPLRFARTVVEADVRILIGRVVPHYFAGFGGGRKALLPGAAGISTILANHKLTLAPTRGIAAGVAPCSLDSNPVHLDMRDGARRLGPCFAVSTLLDDRHNLVDVLAGELEASHADACRRARALHQVLVPRPFDGVITSAGGAPYDCSFVQALKALFNVSSLLRPGGALLWVADCPQGIAPAFHAWARISDDEIETLARQRYDLGAHNTLLLRSLLRNSAVALVSGLEPGEVRNLGVQPVPTLDAGLAWLRERVGAAARVAVVPFANVTHAAVTQPGAQPLLRESTPR
jgi:nickel-dependent lactate racemase